MTKVIYNSDYGGFSLSDKAAELLAKRTGKDEVKDPYVAKWEFDRHDPDLVAVVEELGVEAASGELACLDIAEIEGDRYIIDEYDGNESVITPNDIDWVIIDG